MTGPDGHNWASSPWWLTALIAIATHLGTAFNDRRKNAANWATDWRDRVKVASAEIADDAMKHYTGADELQHSEKSAALILSALQRLSRQLEEATFSIDLELLRARSGLRAFKDAISDHEDFQNSDRRLRAANDPLLENIRQCEHEFNALCSVAVTKRSR